MLKLCYYAKEVTIDYYYYYCQKFCIHLANEPDAARTCSVCSQNYGCVDIIKQRRHLCRSTFVVSFASEKHLRAGASDGSNDDDVATCVICYCVLYF